MHPLFSGTNEFLVYLFSPLYFVLYLLFIYRQCDQQAGPHPWAIENFALVAKYPSAQIVSQVCW